ncbi:MAG: transposase [Promethearchaeota archaeon]
MGYCASKKLAYIGYKCHLVNCTEDMTVLDFSITPANIHDSKLFSPLISALLASDLSDLVKEAYGDNAYNTTHNRELCKKEDIVVSFHSKEETGKHPLRPGLAKKKSKKRSKIESLFGIAKENLGFGTVRVRGLWRVSIDSSIIFMGWNLGILYAFYTDRWEDRISLKQLLYKQ